MRDDVGRWIPEGLAEGIRGNAASVYEEINRISTGIRGGSPGNGAWIERHDCHECGLLHNHEQLQSRLLDASQTITNNNRPVVHIEKNRKSFRFGHTENFGRSRLDHEQRGEQTMSASFEYKGVNSLDMYMRIRNEIVFTSPEADVDFIEVLGRDGELAIDNERLKGVPFSIPVTLKLPEDIQSSKWHRDSGMA